MPTDEGTVYHATPYYEIRNLYKVAHSSYGIRTLFRKLRNSDSESKNVGLEIGHDMSARTTAGISPVPSEGRSMQIV